MLGQQYNEQHARSSNSYVYLYNTTSKAASLHYSCTDPGRKVPTLLVTSNHNAQLYSVDFKLSTAACKSFLSAIVKYIYTKYPYMYIFI